MSTKRDKPQEGLHGIIPAKNTGKEYTMEEYNLIFFLTVRGLPFDQIARIMNRGESAIIRAWGRLCRNATDYEDKKEYQLRPLCSGELGYLNQWAKQYAIIQFVHRKTLPTQIAKRIAKKIGCSYDMIHNYLAQVMGTQFSRRKSSGRRKKS